MNHQKVEFAYLGVFRVGGTDLSHTQHNQHTKPNTRQVQNPFCYHKTYTEKQITGWQEWHYHKHYSHCQNPETRVFLGLQGSLHLKVIQCNMML